jgi:hypothetical protein
VTLEILRGKAVQEEYGILKEYSAKYIELLNVKTEVPIQMYLKDRSFPSGSPVRIERGERAIRVTNELDRTLLVEAVLGEGEARQVNVPVHSMESAEIQLLEGETAQSVQLDTSVRSLADLIVPRALAVVRHAGKREKISLEVLLGLDELPAFPWAKRLFGATRRAGFNESKEL